MMFLKNYLLTMAASFFLLYFVLLCRYTLDRTMAMSLGRPPGIADADIDAHLPNDVDCVDISQDPRRGVMTSMTSSIHVIKL